METEGKWQLPRKYQATPEKLEKWNAEQAELARSLTFRKKEPRDILFDNAIIRIEELNRLLDDKAAPFNSFMARTLAECYAIIGNFDAAAFHEPDAELAAEYEAINEAIKREDQSRCQCRAPETLLTNVAPVQEVFHPKLNRYVELLKCSICRRFTVKL
jgi:hypothetical protein